MLVWDNIVSAVLPFCDIDSKHVKSTGYGDPLADEQPGRRAMVQQRTYYLYSYWGMTIVHNKHWGCSWLNNCLFFLKTLAICELQYGHMRRYTTRLSSNVQYLRLEAPGNEAAFLMLIQISILRIATQVNDNHNIHNTMMTPSDVSKTCSTTTLKCKPIITLRDILKFKCQELD